ncbi:pre-piRNA 3'-exonuclease trimmer-like [Macrosteles quadrilineatus]|uniref:pre-piRNA 3'-exonuclease trimmer-like n=1 Tax=Macrosteles quadrilineatus TaxID=74068 RepID=UPI0023E20909|nr:pre-piRNA 3'-exonuclease trimmer-like [Macrosteles quadrilineatus]
MLREIVKTNYKDNYQLIETSLKKAAFIAIDAEFSGLVSHSKLKNSLFDSAAERYLKLKCSIEQFTIFQFGLSIFHYDRDSNKYVADVYSFHTFPCSFGPVDNRFLCQASSWEFLRAHKFNFNKVAYEGVPFLSNDQEHEIRRQLKDETMFANVERSLSYQDEDVLQAQCSRVSQWLPTAPVDDSIYINIGDSEYCLRYFLHKEIRSKFKDVWTFQLPSKIQVQKLKREEIRKAKELEGDRLDLELIDSITGFAKIFKLLVALKKPLIGHNLLLDLMILYNQMYQQLPSTYKVFKKELNALFPSIMDTKFISYRVKDILRNQDCWSDNRLDTLYMFLNSARGKALASFSPAIEVTDKGGASCSVENVESHLHEAAWDAFMSGHCFIRMAHYLAIRRLGEGALPRPMSRVEHVAAMTEFRNCVNIIRGSVSHMNIGGPEPPSNRPRLLYVVRLDNNSINLSQVAAMLAPHSSGSVDVKAHTRISALVAVPNQNSARSIIKAFVKDREYNVVNYFYPLHSSVATFLWGGLIFSGSFIVTAALVMHIRKSN